MKIGFGYDSHRLVEGRRLILGGVEIPYEKGLLGHSDADALVHALCDAILGAAGLGDLGGHFPDTDPAYKDISSLVILERVRDMAAGKGYIVGNVDATIVAERPRLRGYVDAMAGRIAGILQVSPEAINIKAKTNEGMGFTGRAEGVAAFAVVLMRRQPA
ncbi:MAG: 2-C-methyl-D-erythritol 2,4-cyclodiphosphate synthase [Deltaproteobacteria bacterium]|nr:2-C-methyl-D-erythritol 2,4-cyclodiphosphate synthase [Deltaproteobacteria bacterium]